MSFSLPVDSGCQFCSYAKLRKLHNLVDALSRFCRYEQHRNIAHERKINKHFLFEFLSCVCIFFNKIPLVDNEYGSLSFLVYIAGNAHVPVRSVRVPINNNERNITAANGCKRADNTVTLNGFIFNRTLAAYARSVYQSVFLIVPCKW